MADDTPFPPVSNELLAALQARFPNVCPGILERKREVRARAGEQRVLAFLTEQNRIQNEETAKSNVLR